MTDPDTRPQDVLARMRDVAPALEEPETARARENEHVARIEEWIDQAPAWRRRQRWMRRAWYAALPLAAGVALAIGWNAGSASHDAGPGAIAAAPAVLEQVTGDVQIVGDSARVGTIDGTLQVGERVATGEAASARLRLPDQVRAVLGGQSELALTRLDGPDARVDLARGSVQTELPALRQGESFSVVTPDARVTVVGTQFTVRVIETDDGRSQTCVAVQSGRVMATSEQGQAALSAGQRWSSTGRGCGMAEKTPNPATSAQADGAQPAPSTPVRAPRPASSASADQTAEPSALGRQNELYAAAVSARRAGRKAEARRLLNQLLADYPRGPLAEVARRERVRLDAD